MRVLKPLIYDAKPLGAVHNAFNASGEDGLKCLRDLTFLLDKQEREVNMQLKDFPSYSRIGWNVLWGGQKYLYLFMFRVHKWSQLRGKRNLIEPNTQ